MAIVSQIIEVLDRFGGSAHRDEVVAQIVRERAVSDRAEAEHLKFEVYAVFREHCEDRSSDESQALFRQVFGPESRRWGLSSEAQSRLRQGGLEVAIPAP